jgi:sodium/proline symporter
MLIGFFLFFTLFTLIGVAAALKRRSTIDDYFLASKGVNGWMVALSYGATISSGATFIGFAGLAYATGISAIYAVAALTIGDYIAWKIAGTKIRTKTNETGAHTYPSLIGKLGEKPFPHMTLFAAVLSVVFLGAYCSAQLIAGAKVGQALFDWDYEYFIWIGALVLFAYCWAGGIRASIWTDAVQAIMIVVSLLVLVIAGLMKIGGIETLISSINTIDPSLLDPFQFSLLPIIVGWLFFGIGVLGQPQLMVRHMVASSDEELLKARRIYFLWRWSVLILSCLSGLVARVLIPASESFDPELSIPALWEELLPPVVVGFLLAGLFSATMSTADSLLLCASSALTQHILPGFRNSYAMARIGTLIVIGLVVAIAMVADKGILSLVILAWAGLASALVPLIILQLLGRTITQRQALTMAISGFAVMAIWRYGLGWHTHLMDLVPGMITGFVVYGITSLKTKLST